MSQHTFDAVGYQADWLNGWLAAIGITVADDQIRLSWSNDPIPHARFESPYPDLPNILYQQLPSADDLKALPIIREADGRVELPYNVELDAFKDRVGLERAHSSPSLAVCITDLAPLNPKKPDGILHRSHFYVGAQQGTTLYERAMACRDHVTSETDIADSFNGRQQRVGVNGLGFDVRRISSRADKTGPHVDPVAELFAFLGLTLFPTRGNGRTGTTRGWTGPVEERGAFRWGTWQQPRDRWAIDAWLDRFHTRRHTDVSGVYQTVPYPRIGSDSTYGFASEPAP